MKKTIIAVITGIAIGLLVGCGTGAKAKHDSPLNIWYESENGYYQVLRVIDDKTKVNYIVVQADTGNAHRGLGIVPRYNADGSLYTGE